LFFYTLFPFGGGILKIFFRIFLALIVLIVAAAVAIPFLLSPGLVAEQVVAQVKERTGRTLTFGDDPSFSIFPDIAVTLKNAALSNPPGMPEGNFAQMKNLRLKVALTPLLQKRVEVKEFVLSSPNVNLLVTGNGKVNWSFANALAGEPSGAGTAVGDALTPTDVKLGPVKIQNGTLLYLDERSGASFKANDVNLDLSVPRIGGPIAINGSLVWNKERVKLSLKAPDPLKLANGGSSRVQMTLAAKPISIGYSGTVSLKNGFALNGGVNAKLPNLRALAAWAGQPFAPGNGLGPFVIKSKIKYGADKLSLSGAALSLDDMNGQGEVVLSLKSKIPSLVARLGVDQININTYLSQKPAAPQEGAGWSKAAIDFGALRSVSAKLSLTTGRILYNKTTLTNVSLDAKVRGGVMNVNLKKINLYGGKATGQLVLNGSKKTAALSGVLKANGVKAFSLLRDFAGFEWVDGTTTINLKVNAVGANQAQLVSTLRGGMAIKFTDGSIRGVNIAQALRGVSKNILNGWNSEPAAKTDFSEMSSTFAIAKGRAITTNFKMIGPLVRLTGKGYADMPAKKLNFKITPKLVASLQGQGGTDELAGLEVPIKVKGPWANPKIYPDIKGILENPAQAYKALDNLLKTGSIAKKPDTKAVVKSVTKQLENQTIGKAEEAVAKEIGVENAEVLKETGKKFLKSLFGN
jgi:AsmA protein